MWTSLTLALVLAAPKAPAQAEYFSYAPKVDGVTQLVPFFSAAGTRSLLLRPDTWAADAHALINVNLLDADALARSGIDGSAGLTRTQLGDAVVSCVTVKDVEAYRAACDAKVKRMGEVFQRVENGITINGSMDPLGRVLVAWAMKGRESCAINGHGRSIDAQLPALAKLLTQPTKGPGVTMAAKQPGALQLVVPSGRTHGVVSLTGNGLTLTADARLKGAQLANFAGGGESPLARFAPAGMAVVRARLAKDGLDALVQQVVRGFPQGATLAPLAQRVTPYLTGNVAAFASHARVTTGLRTKEARFFALKMALVAEVSDVAAVEAVLATLDPKSLVSREGTLSVGLHGNFLVVANDADVRAKSIAAIASAAGKQAHGAEFVIDPRLVARGLQQVPLLEAVQSAELAGLVAAGSELGPLLLASTRIGGWVDSSTGAMHLGRLTWELDEQAFKAPASDAGVPTK